MTSYKEPKKPSRLWSLKASRASENYTKKATVREINSDER
jgi:hypothetical protein